MGLLAPLRASAVYRHLWLASVASNFGTMMQSVAVAWLMTSLTDSPLLISLVPFMALSPIFVLGLFAGAFADILDRRVWLICTQMWMLLISLSMALFALFGLTNPIWLLLLMLGMGIGNALNVPCWQALIQDLVPAEMVASAVSLNSMSFNTARMLGPVAGGVIVGWAGSSTVFFINSLSYLGVVAVLVAWHPEARVKTGQKLRQAIIEGLAYLVGAHHLRSPLIRVTVFCLAASSSMALLPLIAREQLGLNVQEYGFLLAFFGLGALAGGALTPAVRKRLRSTTIVNTGTATTGLSLAILAGARTFEVASAAIAVLGLAWIASLINLNVSVQTSVPGGLRGRAMAAYITLFQGSMALGALLAGAVAKVTSIPFTLAAAALLLAAWLPVCLALPIPGSIHKSAA